MPSFTAADTKEAIRLTKSSIDNGPDGMRILHLKKHAHGAINYLTIFSHSYLDIALFAATGKKAILANLTSDAFPAATSKIDNGSSKK